LKKRSDGDAKEEGDGIVMLIFTHSENFDTTCSANDTKVRASEISYNILKLKEKVKKGRTKERDTRLYSSSLLLQCFWFNQRTLEELYRFSRSIKH
jgi:hypothetical protein